MKKTIKVLILISLVFLFCGCSAKLECVKKTEKETNEISVVFANNKPKKLKWIKDYIYSYDDPYIDMKYLELNEEYQLFNNVEGITYKITKNYNDISIKMDINYEKYADNINYSFPIITDDIENNKRFLTENGYTCK